MQKFIGNPAPSDCRASRNWTAGVLALFGIVVLALVGVVMNNPTTATWVSDAAQAEFVGTDMAPDTAPTQLAQPAKEIRTVKAY